MRLVGEGGGGGGGGGGVGHLEAEEDHALGTGAALTICGVDPCL